MNNTELNVIGGQFASKIGRHITSTYYSDYRLSSIKFDYGHRRRSSRGGIYAAGPGINIAMNWFPKSLTGVGRFYEYPSFDANKTIGGFYYDDPILKLKAIIVHEMAHTIQFFEYKKTGTRCKPHGPIFKKYYSELREHFINSLLKDQIQLKIKYEKAIEDITRNGTVSYS